jgi:VCBS repeat-containing protein
VNPTDINSAVGRTLLSMEAQPVSLSQQLLESADYARDGADLVLTGKAGNSFVVEGYFNSSPPADLIADNGAFLSGQTVELLAGPEPVQYAQATGGAAAGQGLSPIGKVETLEGSATVQRASGGTEDLKVGTPVFKGDVVSVSDAGKLGITFEDNSVFSLSNGGTLALNEMVYNPDSSSNKMLFNLVKGSLGFVTGEIAGTGGVEVETPVAVMAIRGTTPLAVQQADGSYAILSAEGKFLLSPKLPNGRVVEVTGGDGAYIISPDGTTQFVPITDPGLQSLVGSILNHLRASTQEKTERESNDTGSPFFDSDTRFGDVGSEILLIKLAQLLAPLLNETELELEPDVNGNYPPVFIVAEGDTSTPPPIPETDSGLFASGTLTVLDANQPDSVTTEVLSVVASGTTTGLQSDEAALLAMLEVVPGVAEADAGDLNNVTWTFDSGTETFDYLADDETLTLTYQVIGRDGPGALDEIAFVIVIDGTNDRPQITAVTVTGAVAEDIDLVADNPNTPAAETTGFLTTDGSIDFLDVDLSDRTNSSVSLDGLVTTGPPVPSSLQTALENAVVLSGDIADANNGTVSWSFALDNDLVQYLADGETITLTYVIAVQDDSGVAATDTATQTVTIVIEGTNDTPVISVEAEDSDGETLTETDAGLSVSGTLTTTDIDLSDTVTTEVVSVAETGTVNGLGSDNAALEAMLTLTAGAIDADTGDVNNLDWAFDSGSEAFDYLADGESLTLTYQIRVQDDSGVAASDTSTLQTVTIVIEGTNDTPVISVEAEDSDGETLSETDAGLSVSGTLTTTDIDLSDTVTAQVVSVAESGTVNGLGSDNAALEAMLTLTAGAIDADTGDVNNLDWAFDSGSEAFDYLADGESLTLTYQIRVQDDSGVAASDTSTLQTVTIVIEGTNDTPVISVEAEDSDGETLTETDAGLSVSGTLTTTDIDLSDTVTTEVVSVAESGTVNGLGSDNAALEAMLTLTAGAIDADTGDVNNLDWAFDSGSEAFDYLADGESLTLTYQIRVQDDSGVAASDTSTLQTVTIVIEGTNDTPVISVEAEDSDGETLTETDAGLSISGTLTTTDIDLSDTVTTEVVSVAESGTVNGLGSDNAALEAMLTLTAGAIDADTGDVNNLGWAFDSGSEAFDYLADGESLTLTYQIRVQDDSGVAASDTSSLQTVTIVIEGTNDTPVISVEAEDSDGETLTETDAGLSVSGTLTTTDIDLSDTVTTRLSRWQRAARSTGWARTMPRLKPC